MTHRRSRNRARLQLEALEDRVVLNNRFVVPAGVPVDNVSTFASLSKALYPLNLNAGDTIQIEPGSTPGNVTSGELESFADFSGTIQGNPAAARAAIPMFTVNEPTNLLPLAASSFTLN